VRIAAHIEKYRRLATSLQRFDPRSDPELWIWTAMNAGVHLLNAALHHAGITDEVDSFHTQVEGLYVVPDRTNGTFADVIHAPGDVMHVGQPPIERQMPAAIELASASLKVIEDLREAYVRGSDPIREGAEAEWVRAYEACVKHLLEVLGASSPGAAQ
jgi:hypothetical protein